MPLSISTINTYTISYVDSHKKSLILCRKFQLGVRESRIGLYRGISQELIVEITDVRFRYLICLQLSLTDKLATQYLSLFYLQLHEKKYVHIGLVAKEKKQLKSSLKPRQEAPSSISACLLCWLDFLFCVWPLSLSSEST